MGQSNKTCITVCRTQTQSQALNKLINYEINVKFYGKVSEIRKVYYSYMPLN